jgi:hypothetical protein
MASVSDFYNKMSSCVSYLGVSPDNKLPTYQFPSLPSASSMLGPYFASPKTSASSPGVARGQGKPGALVTNEKAIWGFRKAIQSKCTDSEDTSSLSSMDFKQLKDLMMHRRAMQKITSGKDMCPMETTEENKDEEIAEKKVDLRILSSTTVCDSATSSDQSDEERRAPTRHLIDSVGFFFAEESEDSGDESEAEDDYAHLMKNQMSVLSHAHQQLSVQMKDRATHRVPSVNSAGFTFADGRGSRK